MPFNFLEIEERKNRSIAFLFVFLCVFYFLGAYLLYAAASLGLTGGFVFSGRQIALIGLFSIGVAVLHWFFSISGMVGRILEILKAGQPDPQDSYHQVFQNIIEEVGIATGARNIECVCLPTVALNSFSISDFRGRAVIGVTEGLLAGLNRSQLEAVVAHEAAHIVSGDTLLKTVSVSLFGVYGALLKGLQKGARMLRDSRGRTGLPPGFWLVYLAALAVYAHTKLLSMFISRECEYRADAVAVRLVRDPLSLAQSLYIIGRKWRGGGLGYEYLESIFIFNPHYSRLDERSGLCADLFSTHPPLDKRIGVLLQMANADMETLVREAQMFQRPRTREGLATVPQPRWYAAQGNRWLGPLAAHELLALEWLRYDSFVRKEGTAKIGLLYEDAELSDLLRHRGGCAGSFSCPRCGQSLRKASHEGMPVSRCDLCEGQLLEENELPRAIAREESVFSDEVIRQAGLITDAIKSYSMPHRVRIQPGLRCPKCGNPMLANFYSLAYPIEVDRCLGCGVIWFDKNELEVLECLIEKAQNSQN